MRAAWPAARSTRSGHKFRKTDFDPTCPRLRFFGIKDPTNPLIAGKRRNVIPHGTRHRRHQESFSPVYRHPMDHSASDIFSVLDHALSIPTQNLFQKTQNPGFDKPRTSTIRAPGKTRTDLVKSYSDSRNEHSIRRLQTLRPAYLYPNIITNQ